MRIDVANFTEPDDWVIAIVNSGPIKGSHGFFVEARCFKSRDSWLNRDTKLTFSRDFLPDSPDPEGGMIVVLWRCSTKTKGWRSYAAALYGKDHLQCEPMRLTSQEEALLASNARKPVA